MEDGFFAADSHFCTLGPPTRIHLMGCTGERWGSVLSAPSHERRYSGTLRALTRDQPMSFYIETSSSSSSLSKFRSSCAVLFAQQDWFESKAPSVFDVNLRLQVRVTASCTVQLTLSLVDSPSLFSVFSISSAKPMEAYSVTPISSSVLVSKLALKPILVWRSAASLHWPSKGSV